MSMYEPGYSFPGDADIVEPLGYRFQHNFMSWLDWQGGTADVVLHTVGGRDLLFEYESTAGDYKYFTPQPGHHYDYLRYYSPSSGPDSWELRTLHGVTYRYDFDTSRGRLTEIEDPTGEKLSITYDDADTGQVDRVTDASGNKYLQFEYYASSPRLLQYVKFYTDGSPDTLETTVSYSYTSEKLVTIKRGDVSALEEIETLTYDTNDYLIGVEDGDHIERADFAYDTGTAGKVVVVETGDGNVGYDFSPPAQDCAGTYVFYHRANTTACDADADCGSGLYCGGETDPSATDTGICFRVRRCVLVDSPNEDLVTAVSAECEGQSCPSAVDVSAYDWETGAGDETIELVGRKSADNIWTSYDVNSNGLATVMVEGDTDSDASTIPTGARTTYYTYGDTSFPGKVTERRRLSELKPGGTCTASVSTDCYRVVTAYDTAGLVSSIRRIGYTQNASGTVVAFDYTTTYEFDSKGRLEAIRGPRGTDDDVEYLYWSAAGGAAKEGYLKQAIRTVTASRTLEYDLNEYDAWGNATELVEPSGKVRCAEFDSHHGQISELRVLVGPTACTGSSSNDLTTSFTHTASGQLTELEKPEDNCVHYEYDARGRLETLKSRDGCSPSAAGDNIEYEYDVDGLRTLTEFKDSAGTVRYRREHEYHPDRRLKAVLNPVSPTHKKLYEYWDDGLLRSIEFENSLGRTEHDYDDLNRETDRRRFTDATNYDTWLLTPSEQLQLSVQTEDDDTKAIDRVYDDLGRLVEQETPDSGTTRLVYDESGNLTSKVEAAGTSSAVTHTFVYDNQGRLLEENYGSITCGIGEGAELQYSYDLLPTGIACPSGADCSNLDGRLSYVKSKMFCDSTETDKTFDQETFHSYDSAGRIVKQHIADDSGRRALTVYHWDKNSNLTEVERPSGTKVHWQYGLSTENSDDDKIAKVNRREKNGTLVEVVGDIHWEPFGPVLDYLQKNERDGERIRASFEWNLAFRPVEIVFEEDSSSDDLFEIDYTEDEMGRVTVRDYSHGHASLQDSHYSYDQLSRVTCDSAATGSCPTSGTNLKSTFDGSPPFTASGERTQLTHSSSVYGTNTYPVALWSGKDQIARVGIGTGSRVVGYSWDRRGNRTSEDDNQLSYDRRTFTYDGRNNVRTVRAKYKPSSPPGQAWRYYTVTNAYDHKNRRVFKSFLDENTNDEAHWFFYYDIYDRLTEVKHTPDVSDASTYSLIHYFWINDRPVAYTQVDYPSRTTTRRFLHTDELRRPLEAWSDPSSGNTQRVWAINPDLFAWDDIIVGSNVYQPLRFPGQYRDADTAAWESMLIPARPPLHDNRHRTFDPFTGTYLQVDPLVSHTWEAYNYVGQNPVGKTDKRGLAVDISFLGLVRWEAEVEWGGGFCSAEWKNCYTGDWADQLWYNFTPDTGGSGGWGGFISGGIDGPENCREWSKLLEACYGDLTTKLDDKECYASNSSAQCKSCALTAIVTCQGCVALALLGDETATPGRITECTQACNTFASRACFDNTTNP